MKTNYHTHTVFCDGKAQARDMVLDAINSHFKILGFSSHAAFPFDSDWHLKNNRYTEYCTTINELKTEFTGKIEIQLGFEADFVPSVALPDYSVYSQFKPDFLIGSVHYVLNFDKPELAGFPQKDCFIPYNCFAIDGSTEEVKAGIDSMFEGNGKLAAQTYFSFEREMVLNYKFDIIGHPDVLRKRNALLQFVDPSEEWYKRELFETAKAIAKSGKVCEINYGGICRGTLADTYPSLYFLKLLKKFDVPVTINADAHDVGQMDVGYDFALKQAKAAGYSETHYIRNGLWYKTEI